MRCERAVREPVRRVQPHAPQRPARARRATASAVPHGVVGEVDEHRDVHLVARSGARRPSPPPPCRRRRPRSARAGWCRRRGRPTTTPARRSRRRSPPPTCAAQPSPGLHEPVVVAGGEEEDRLAARGLDHLGDVAHDQRAAGQAAEVDRLEVGEQRIRRPRSSSRSPTARSRRPRAARAPRAVPAALPAAVRAPPSGALLEHRDRPRRCRRGSSSCAGTPASSRAGCGPRARAAPSCS